MSGEPGWFRYFLISTITCRVYAHVENGPRNPIAEHHIKINSSSKASQTYFCVLFHPRRILICLSPGGLRCVFLCRKWQGDLGSSVQRYQVSLMTWRIALLHVTTRVSRHKASSQCDIESGCIYLTAALSWCWFRVPHLADWAIFVAVCYSWHAHLIHSEKPSASNYSGIWI